MYVHYEVPGVRERANGKRESVQNRRGNFRITEQERIAPPFFPPLLLAAAPPVCYEYCKVCRALRNYPESDKSTLIYTSAYLS